MLMNNKMFDRFLILHKFCKKKKVLILGLLQFSAHASQVLLAGVPGGYSRLSSFLAPAIDWPVSESDELTIFERVLKLNKENSQCDAPCEDVNENLYKTGLGHLTWMWDKSIAPSIFTPIGAFSS